MRCRIGKSPKVIVGLVRMFVSYQEMQSVLSKSLLLYQNGHTGRIPRKVFVHKSTHFTEDETQGLASRVYDYIWQRSASGGFNAVV